MRKRILAADDEPGITQMLKLCLEEAGHFEVCEENDSRRVIQTAREFQPDVILLDIMMPDPNGSEIAAMLASDPALSDIPVIMLTALVSTATTSQPRFGLPSSHYLPKPVDFSELIQLLESITRRPNFGRTA